VRAPSISDVFAVPRAVWRARRALDRGDLGGARELVGPLLETYGGVTFIRKLAAEVLYASADPLSAASFFEQVAKKRPDDRAVVVGLVASYAALDRAGDARRSAARLPEDVDVRLALAWAELVAKGGDPARGEAIVAALASDGELQRSRERIGMHRALAAIVAARQSDNGALRGRLREAEGELRRLRAGSHSELRPSKKRGRCSASRSKRRRTPSVRHSRAASGRDFREPSAHLARRARPLQQLEEVRDRSHRRSGIASPDRDDRTAHRKRTDQPDWPEHART